MNHVPLSRKLFVICLLITAGLAASLVLYGCRAASPPPRSSGEHGPTKATPPPPSPEIAAFPWPPPQASSRVVLSALARDTSLKTLGDVDRKLSGALLPKGYIERSYYSVPGGFALVTRLEQIYSDGRSMPSPARFSAQLLPPSRFADYLRALFTANPGYYRVIVFIATSQGVNEAATAPSQEQANGWVRNGVDVLPASIADQPVSGGFHCTALIYQFQQSNASSSDKAQLISNVDPVVNLTNAGLWQALN